jgi:hypothetical protein
VHHLVAEAFLPPKPSPAHQLRHLDGDSENNRASNLAWGTSLDNHADRRRHDRIPHGVGVYCAKLNDEDVRVIRASHESDTALARHYGVAETTIRYARLGRTWRHVT